MGVLSKVLPLWRWHRMNSLRPKLFELIEKERDSLLSRRLTFRERLDCWKSGFLSESRILYAFGTHPKADYLTDYARFTKGQINSPYTELLANKVMFDAVMRAFPSRIPTTYAVVTKKKLHCLVQTPKLHSPQEIAQWCLAGNSMVLKPRRGISGTGIKMITSRNGELFQNSKRATFAELVSLLENIDEYLIQEKVEQAEYSRKIYPYTTNTIRALTMWDSKTGDPFVAAAVHRFGSEKSFPVDNWTRGGFSSLVDLETGTLSRAVTYPTSGKLEWRDDHPNTHERIEGIKVLNWHEIHRQLLEIATAFPYLRYVGWDIVVDAAGSLKILEGNCRSDVNLLQVHKPLLQDPRVREFYLAN